MKDLVVIPMRGGSKGLPGKHLFTIGGDSVAKLTLDQAKKELPNCDILVSTDCRKIEKHCQRLDCMIHTREIDTSHDGASTESVLRLIAEKYHNHYRSAIYLSACELSRADGFLNDLFKSHMLSGCDSSFYVERLPKKVWVKSEHDFRLIKECSISYKPRQDVSSDTLFLEHTGLGLVTSFKYWLRGQRFGGTINPLELPNTYRHIDLHEKIDLKFGSICRNI